MPHNPRLHRLLRPKSGRSFVVALDHAFFAVPADLTAIEDLPAVLDAVTAVGPDGVLMSAGQARLLAQIEGRTAAGAHRPRRCHQPVPLSRSGRERHRRRRGPAGDPARRRGPADQPARRRRRPVRAPGVPAQRVRRQGPVRALRAAADGRADPVRASRRSLPRRRRRGAAGAAGAPGRRGRRRRRQGGNPPRGAFDAHGRSACAATSRTLPEVVPRATTERSST